MLKISRLKWEFTLLKHTSFEMNEAENCYSLMVWISELPCVVGFEMCMEYKQLSYGFL